MKIHHLFLIFLFLFNGKTFSQNSKHEINSAEIVFDITYPDSQLDDQTLQNLPTESDMKVKGDMVRMEMSMQMGKTIMISDNKTKTSTMLMDIMGNKMMMEMNKEDIEKQKQTISKPKVELTRETKTIAGYNCTKAVVSVDTKKGPSKFDVWFTNDVKFKNSFASQIEGIDGFLMEFVTAQNGMNLKMTARKVEVKDIDAAEFNIPDGYKKINPEDLKKMRGHQ